MLKKILLLLILVAGTYSEAYADLKVFACEPEWASLAEELGGDKLHVSAVTTALQDPHHVQARPSLIARLRRADILICTGADLEVGWLPVLLRRAGNANVQPGKTGYFEAASAVALLDRPARLDRAQGDVHPQGNPHIQTDPHNILPVAKVFSQRLIELDGENKTYYEQRLEDFSQRWNQALQHWDEKGKALKGLPIVVQHRGWTYMKHWLGLNQVAVLEPKPGVPPSSADLSKVLSKLKSQPAAAVVRAAYQDDRPSAWLQENADIPQLVLPFTVGGDEKSNDLFGLYDRSIELLLSVKKP
ncbi:metal ABC transporter solute-binding protein, Zn/Mn family [Thiolapillus sp.]|nr:zinc ABC transporter substrate-binding protein [Thiolapillus sp.]